MTAGEGPVDALAPEDAVEAVCELAVIVVYSPTRTKKAAFGGGLDDVDQYGHMRRCVNGLVMLTGAGA